MRRPPFQREGNADGVEAHFPHAVQFARQLAHFAREHGIDQRHEAVFLGLGADQVMRLDIGHLWRLRRGIEKQRQLVDLRLRQPDIEIGRAGNSLGKITAQPQTRRVGHDPHVRRYRAQVRRIEHCHQPIVTLEQQLGGAGLVGCRGGDDDHRAGPFRLADVGKLEEGLDRVMGFLAGSAHKDMAGAAEQRCRARLVRQPGVAGSAFISAPDSSIRSPASGSISTSFAAAAKAPASSCPQKK